MGTHRRASGQRGAPKGGRHGEPSAGIVEARSVRGSASVSKKTKDSTHERRSTAARPSGSSIPSDFSWRWSSWRRASRTTAVELPLPTASSNAPVRFAKIRCGTGLKCTFIEHCRSHHVGVEVVNRIHPGRFEALPKLWIIEPSRAWLMNSQQLQVDYERERS